ncbi:hypothetical protein OB955_22575 [Halobacteria archaeon AArc-m2/3/4]|uniref:Uncharacterized protein n=1 Tax=Natronoglomus mannanivorans TaxID=2979990 RepID=A0ABT2QKL6_9EURY|nr:hypothetical protein [Halobacteria archaeon AArc-m2/3/4]
MAFRELLHQLLGANIMMGVLLAFSYAGIQYTGAEADAETYIVVQLGAAIIIVNFLVLSAALYFDWSPV